MSIKLPYERLATTLIFSLSMFNALSQKQFQLLIHPGMQQEARCMKAAVGGGYLLASNFKDNSGQKFTSMISQEDW